MYGEDDPKTLRAEEYLAINLYNLSEVARAKALFAHIYEVRSETLGPDSEETQWVGRIGLKAFDED